MSNKNILAFYSDTNSKGKHDATGAFIPEAKQFAKLHGVGVDNVIGITCVGVPATRRREQVLDIIHDVGTVGPIDVLALFCHGWKDGIQFGFNRDNIDDLVGLLYRKASPDLRIVLYACLTAENDTPDTDVEEVGPGTDGGFADLLRDKLAALGFRAGWVDAHKTRGHATINPYVVRFLYDTAAADPEFDGEGGSWLIAPRSESWSEWVRACRDQNGGLRYRFPLMSQLEVLANLHGLPWTELSAI